MNQNKTQNDTLKHSITQIDNIFTYLYNTQNQLNFTKNK